MDAVTTNAFDLKLVQNLVVTCRFCKEYLNFLDFRKEIVIHSNFSILSYKFTKDLLKKYQGDFEY